MQLIIFKVLWIGGPLSRVRNDIASLIIHYWLYVNEPYMLGNSWQRLFTEREAVFSHIIRYNLNVLA